MGDGLLNSESPVPTKLESLGDSFNLNQVKMQYTIGVIESFLQTESWANFKERFGWKAHRLGRFWLLERTLALGKTLAYLPELPLDEEAIKQIREFKSPPKNRILTRFEFLVPWTADRAKILLDLGLVKSFEDVQPEYRQWLDLQHSEEKILAQMKPKGRYNVRLAERHNLKTEYGSDSGLVERFFQLYAHTSERADFSGRDLNYFQQLVTMLAKHRAGEVVVISKDDQDLSAMIISYYPGLASYLYGGSGGDRSLMAPYLMHWQAIKRAKERQCKIYDLLAVAPPADTEALADKPDQETHRYAQLTRFKTQFGGQTVRLLGSWDLVHKPFWYRIYQIIERRRRRL